MERGVTGQPLLARTKDGGSGKKQRVQLREQGANPLPSGRAYSLLSLVLVTGQNSLVKGTWYLPGRKSVLYAMANIQERGRSCSINCSCIYKSQLTDRDSALIKIGIDDQRINNGTNAQL